MIQVKKKHCWAGLSAITLSATLSLSLVTPAMASDTSPDESNVTVERSGLVLPPVDAGFREYIALVDDTLTGDDRYSTVRILRDRTGAEIYWDGEPSDSLRALVDAAPEGFVVAVVDTPFSPAELRAEVDRLIRTDGVLSARATPEADSLIVTLDTDVRLQRSATSLTNYPLEIDPDEPTPTNRFDDPNPIAGLLYGVSGAGRCTAGFAATTIGGSARMLSAAHCGPTGAAVTHHTNGWAGNQISGPSLGTILGRNITHDAAGIGGGSLTYAPPFVWLENGLANTENSLGTIDGTINPVVGDEICLSGSYSGYSCGHIVEGTDTWNYTDTTSVPAMYGITGYVTDHEGNQLYTGSGDSGGPGIIWTTSGTYAATITSGSRNRVDGYCDAPSPYNPFDTSDRTCGRRALLTSARAGAAAFGLTITTW